MTAVYATMAAGIATGGDAWTVPVTLSYTAADPVAVTMLIPSSGGVTAVWVFARSLLTDGMTTCAGDGDVTVFWLGGDILHIGLTNGYDQAFVLLPRAAAVHFLCRTYVAVPPGREPVDVDGAIAAILGGVR